MATSPSYWGKATDLEKRRRSQQAYRLRHPERVQRKNKEQWAKQVQRKLVDPEYALYERERKIKAAKKYRDSHKGKSAQQVWAAKKLAEFVSYKPLPPLFC
jgi:hypothetical protein